MKIFKVDLLFSPFDSIIGHYGISNLDHQNVIHDLKITGSRRKANIILLYFLYELLILLLAFLVRFELTALELEALCSSTELQEHTLRLNYFFNLSSARLSMAFP